MIWWDVVWVALFVTSLWGLGLGHACIDPNVMKRVRISWVPAFSSIGMFGEHLWHQSKRHVFGVSSNMLRRDGYWRFQEVAFSSEFAFAASRIGVPKTSTPNSYLFWPRRSIPGKRRRGGFPSLVGWPDVCWTPWLWSAFAGTPELVGPGPHWFGCRGHQEPPRLQWQFSSPGLAAWQMTEHQVRRDPSGKTTCRKYLGSTQ